MQRQTHARNRLVVVVWREQAVHAVGNDVGTPPTSVDTTGSPLANASSTESGMLSMRGLYVNVRFGVMPADLGGRDRRR